ncbi:MAG UNVERIFIED_CONTAM: sulfur carrier protein ThiS [Planctomycetaceae bacterium]|jgi:thiamine biosynthesis protein ThiS
MNCDLMYSIRVNGDQHNVPVGITVADLLSLLQVQTRYCAVELNRRVIPLNPGPRHCLSPAAKLKSSRSQAVAE